MFLEEHFMLVAVLGVAGSLRTMAWRAGFCPNVSPTLPCFVCCSKGRCYTLFPKLSRAGGSGEGTVGLSRARPGMQPMLGGCGAGEVGGRQLTAHWLACLQENILWDMPFGAQCGC